MTDRGSYTVLEYDQLTAERDALAFDLHHQKEVYAGAVLTVNRLTAERDALLADREVLEKALTLTRREADLLKASTLNAAYERLRAELATAEVHVGRLVTHLTELREAVTAYINAEDDDREEEFLAMEAVLAKAAW